MKTRTKSKRTEVVCFGGRGTLLAGVLFLLLALAWRADGAGGSPTNSAGPAAISSSSSQSVLRSFAAPKFVNYRVPERQYEITNVQGWTVYMERDPWTNSTEVTTKAAARLGTNLQAFLQLVPQHTHVVLQKLPIFMLVGEEAANGGRNNGAEYFQKVSPDFWEWTDRHWGSGLVIYSARNYLWLDDQWAMRVLVHEFAHAWQLEQWPEKQEDITAAWENATTNKLYTKIKAINGTVLDSGYATVNQLEYFAELSCAYFWRGEYEPFDRASLERRDPIGFSILEKMWGVNSAAPLPSK